MSVDNYPMGSLFRYDVGIQLKTQTTMEERHVKKTRLKNTNGTMTDMLCLS